MNTIVQYVVVDFYADGRVYNVYGNFDNEIEANIWAERYIEGEYTIRLVYNPSTYE